MEKITIEVTADDIFALILLTQVAEVELSLDPESQSFPECADDIEAALRRVLLLTAKVQK